MFPCSKQPGNDIDVYLSPLIEDLKQLWDTGVEVYDRHRHETFNLRVMLFGTINNFPAYGNLSGYSIKEKCACPICDKDTCLIRLDHGINNVFLGHRGFLPSKHPFRSWKKAFNGYTKEAKVPWPLTGEQLFEKVGNLSNLGNHLQKTL